MKYFSTRAASGKKGFGGDASTETSEDNI